MTQRVQICLCRNVSLALGLLFAWQALKTHAEPLKERSVRAVLLFHIAQLTDWPKTAFKFDDDPFVIGVVGEDPFGSVLDEAVNGELVRGRRIVIERYSSPTDIKTPHMLYIGGSDNRILTDSLSRVADNPTLTVSDFERAERRGAMVRLYWEDNRAKMAINTDAVKRKELVMSPRLLKVAQLYPERR
jgi:hypothetical protein